MTTEGTITATVRSGAVPDHHAACPAHGDEGSECVGQLPLVGERPGVQQIVPVEEVEGWVSHRLVCAEPRRGGAPRRR